MAAETVDYRADPNATTLQRPLAKAKPDHPPVLFGDYVILGELGRGGMGIVYQAEQRSLNRLVALKVIKSAELADAEQVERFRKEAEAAAGLDHPGIVPVHEFGARDGRHFIAMSFVDGRNLAQELARGPLNPREAAVLVKQVAEAVGYAHKRGVIHRDLKPANVILNDEGFPRVTDFGLARRIDDGNEITRTGQVIGTPSYMPPEQALGVQQEISPLSDIYSLGALLYALLTGRPPFSADNPVDTLMQVVDEDPVAPRQLNGKLPKDLETICLKCLEKLPARRYANAEDLTRDLDHWLKGEPIRARPVSRIERTVRWCRRKPTVAALLAAVVIVAVVGFAGVSWQWRIAERGRTSARRSLRDLVQLSRDHYSEMERGRPDPDEFNQRVLTIAIEGLDEVVRADPSGDTARDIVVARSQLGLVHQRENRLNAAKRQYDLAHEIVAAAAAAQPNSLEARRDLSISFERRGDVATDLGEYSVAEAMYQECLNIRQRTARQFPMDQTLIDEAVAEGRIADLFQTRRSPADAMPHYQRAIELLERLQRIKSVQLRAKGVFHLGLGDCHIGLGELLDATEEYQRARLVFLALESHDSQNAQAVRDVGIVVTKLGDAAKQVGDLDAARQHYDQAVDVYARLVELTPDPSARRQLGLSYDNRGDLCREENEPAKARDWFRRALIEFDAVHQSGKGVAENVFDRSVTHRKIGDASYLLRDLPAARRHYEAALSLRVAEWESRLADPRTRDVARLSLVRHRGRLGDVLLRLDDLAEAEQHLQQAKRDAEKIPLEMLNNWPSRLHVAAVYASLGQLYAKTERPQLAKDSFRHALSLLKAESIGPLAPQLEARRIELIDNCQAGLKKP